MFVLRWSLLGGSLAYGLVRVFGYLTTSDNLAVGQDAHLYLAAGARIMAGGPVYPAWEMSGTFDLGQMPELYPPITAYGLFAPMSLLPPILWWAIPLCVLAAVVVHARPSLDAWILIAALAFVWPGTLNAVMMGNPIMWMAAFLALGTLWRPALVLVALKPTLAPVALLGVKSRGWWVAAIVLGAVGLVGLGDYLTVLGNIRTDNGLYWIHDIGFVLIPLVVRR